MRSKTAALFGSSKCRPGESGYLLAERLGYQLAEAGWTILNGGYGGVMEASAKGAKAAGGRVIGVTTREFHSAPNAYLDEEIRVDTWQDRVFHLMRGADAYVVLEGGTGTLVEFSVAVEMINKKLFPEKPVVLYGPFWRSVRDVLEKNEEIRLDFVKTADSCEDVVKCLACV